MFTMNRATLYAVRMVMFVTIWVLAFWLVLDLAPVRQLPIGVFTWLLFEITLRAVNRHIGESKKGNG